MSLPATPPDSHACLRLLEDSPHGLFSMLQEEAMFPKGTDATLLAKLNDVFSNISNGPIGVGTINRPSTPSTPTNITNVTSSSNVPGSPMGKTRHVAWASVDPRVRHRSFAIAHYAGHVTYDIVGFLERNRGAASADLINIMEQSKVRK